MPRPTDRDRLRQLVDQQQAIVAEVLPRAEYEWAHLAGAIHLPLTGWDVGEVESRLHRERPIIVYCNDYQ